jgi:hypothetical protein
VHARCNRIRPRPLETSWGDAFNVANHKQATSVGQDGRLGDVVIAPAGRPEPVLGGLTALERLDVGSALAREDHLGSPQALPERPPLGAPIG